MMRREGERVIIDISKDDHDELMMCLGYATGCLMREGGRAGAFLRLANVINEGNAEYTPYEVGEMEKAMGLPMALLDRRTKHA